MPRPPWMLLQGGFDYLAPALHPQTLGTGRWMPTTLPPWPGHHEWPRGKISHAPCPPPLHKKAARPLPQGRRHPLQSHTLGFSPFALQLNQRSRERKIRGRREEGERKREAEHHHINAQGRVAVNHDAAARSRGRHCPGAPRRSTGR
jgi:hypothetical protein